jgi:phosphate transport system permease protein
MTAIPTMLRTPRPDEDVPIDLNPPPTGIDRAFRGLLVASAVVVLAILLLVAVFLAVKGWPAFNRFGFGFFAGPVWAPDNGQAGVLPLLLGSIAIAAVSLMIALPISLAAALMINEYLPTPFRSSLVMLVDLLATVPSIVYGFWGLEVVSSLQVAPARWLVANFNFVPLIRTPTPDDFGNSIFAVSDMCEASLGLGGTRWGMVTDVILPFSRKGILSGALLGLGRGLGETMIVVLILSSENKVTPGLMGPNGLGSIAKEITLNFPSESAIGKSALILAGLVLFVTTLLVNLIARWIVNRSDGARL